MQKPPLILFLLTALVLVITNTHASETFNGNIRVQLTEQNGSTFRGDNYEKDTLIIKRFSNTKLIYLNQSSGQKVYLAAKNVLFDNKKNSKYHFVLDILENTKDTYKARIKLYLNSLEIDENNKHIILSTEIINEEINGRLNSKNDYAFINDDKPNLKIMLDIDRVFSKEELQERLAKKYEPQTD